MIMANLLIDNMSNWINWWCISLPDWPTPLEPILQDLTKAFDEQCRVGWDQFFCGCITTSWAHAVHTDYHEQWPSKTSTPEQCIQKMIMALWTFSLTLWHHHNAEHHGENGIISKEWRQKATTLCAMAVYQDTIALSPNWTVWFFTTTKSWKS